MEASSKIENGIADKTDPSPQLRLGGGTKPERDDKPMMVTRLAAPRTVKKNAHNPMPETWERAMNDEAEEEPMSGADRGERRRLKQKERRQNWRRNKQETKAKVEKELLLEMQGLVYLLLCPPKAPPTDVDHTAAATQIKRHWLSPEDCTLDFLRSLFDNDTRPSDWDLVCMELGEYARFPYRQLVLPLSRLSALVWETEFRGRRLFRRLRSGVENAEAILTQNDRELRFYRRHMMCNERIWSNWLKYVPKSGYPTMEHLFKVVSYGDLVLRRVIEQLKAQREVLAQQIREKHNCHGNV